MAKIFLEKAIFKNVAPIGDLSLEVKENDVLSLTSVNGKGKTTILSYIADAFFEIARAAEYEDIFKDNTRYYRVALPSTVLDNSIGFSIVYLRFKDDDQHIDYVEIVCSGGHQLTQKEYDDAVSYADKVVFSQIQSDLNQQSSSKRVSLNNQQKIAREILTKNILTYFPADRTETPVWLNNNQYKDARLNVKTRFSSELRKNIEARSISSEVVGWILDVVLDEYINEAEHQVKPYHHQIRLSLNTLLRNILQEKSSAARFGISPRINGDTRLAVVEDINEQGRNIVKTVSPSFFHLSAGEIALMVIGAEIIKQYDTYPQHTTFEPSQIQGIVLIDEVDKHLHIKLQKEVLPFLFEKFPNVQFIVSTHAPFFNMGAKERLKERFRNFSLDIKSEVQVFDDPRYNEVYEMMVDENNRFKEISEALKKELEKNSDEMRTLIITEGKTDKKHLEKAKEMLNIIDCDVMFLQEPLADKDGRGDSTLLALLGLHSKIPQTRKIIGIFDRDVLTTVEEIEGKDKVKLPYKQFGNNVFAFCIPTPESRKDYKNISIEFYYSDGNLKKEKDGKCLFFDNEVEFKQSASNGKNRKLVKLEKAKKDEENTKKIFDENIGDLAWIHSKSRFAELVAGKIVGAENFANDFDFTNFQLIFNKIKEIINPAQVQSDVIDEEPPQAV